MAKSAEEQLQEMISGAQTRGGQYASYYTQMGWQRWDTAADVVKQQIAERKLQFQEASDIYQKELAALEKRRSDLQKRLADIQVKKAAAQIKREDAEWKERNERLRAEYKAKVQQVRDDAYVASSSYSHSWSQSHGTGSGAAARAAGGRDALDEALDEVGADQGQSAKAGISAAVGATVDVKSGAQQLRELKKRQDSGVLDNTEYGSSVVLYGAHKGMVSKLAQQSGGRLSEAQVRDMLDAELNDGVITGNVNKGAQKVLDRAQKGSATADRESMSSSNSSSRGAYYKDYDLPKMEPLQKGEQNLQPLEDAEAEIKRQIAATEGQVPTKPVLEPIDIITATRNEYMTRFGEAPRGTSLQMGGETIAKYKDLMPYELTNALGKVKTFFGNYVQTEIAAAKAAAAGRQLTTDEFNAAVELGKKKAREVLFAGLAARDPQYAAATTTPNAVAGAASAATNVVPPSDAKGWASVGVVKPSTGNNAADEAAYQKAKEDWANTQGIKPQDTQVVKDRIDAYNREVLPDAAMEKQQRDMFEARNAGILPYDIPEGAPLPDVSGLRAPPVTESEYAKLFRDRVAPPAIQAEIVNPDIGAMLEEQRRRIQTDDLRRRSMEGERRAPAMEVKPEGAIGPIPAPPAPSPRPLSDILLRGFQPELERGTGRVVVPPMTPQQRQDAIVGMTSGAQQAQLFPESMAPTAPRTTSEGVSARPLSMREFPFEPPPPPVDPMKSGIFSPVMDPKDLKELMQQRKDLQEMNKPKPPEQGATLQQRDTKAKIEAVAAGTKLATENPAAAGKEVTKDAMGKYIAALYDENKSKGAKAKPVGELTQTIIREYAGDAEKQKRAVEILSSLAALDTTSDKINA